jgi:FkbM family methyltransferase
VDKEAGGRLRSAGDHFKYCRLQGTNTFLDIGASLGVIICKARHEFGGNLNIIAVEVNPIARGMLEKGYPDIKIPKKGAWSKKGKVWFSTPDETNYVHGSISETKEGIEYKDGYVCEVEVDTIDNILLELGVSKVDFIKLDAEGAEVEILKGISSVSVGTQFHIEWHHNNLFGILKELERLEVDIVEIFKSQEPQYTDGYGEVFAEKKKEYKKWIIE